MQKCADWSPEVQADGEGLPPSHNEALGADVIGVVLYIVSCCLEVAALDPQAYCEKKESWRLGKYDNVSKCRDAGVRDQGLNLWLNSLTSCVISGK